MNIAAGQRLSILCRREKHLERITTGQARWCALMLRRERPGGQRADGPFLPSRNCVHAFSRDHRVLSSSLGSMTLLDRKSTRLNSSHLVISYAVFCLKKKKKNSS